MCATDRENESYVLYEHKAVGFRFRMGGGHIKREFIPIEGKMLHLLCCDFIFRFLQIFALFCTIYSRYVLIYVSYLVNLFVLG